MTYNLGAIPSIPDKRNYKLSQFTNIMKEFPAGYLVKPYEFEDQIRVYNQGFYPMCVGFACASIKEQQEYLESGICTRMSPGYIYGNRDIDHWQGEGMYPKEALEMLCKDGVPSYDKFSEMGYYEQCKNLVDERKENLFQYSSQNKTLSYIDLDFTNINEIKTALMKTGAVLLCIAVYDSFYNCPSNGVLSQPSSTEEIQGYHALQIVGWRYDNKWIVVNSWGRWGHNGICYMPFNYEGTVEMWSITDMIKQIPKTEISIKIGENYYTVNDIQKPLDVPAKIINNRTFVPLRFIAESLGVLVFWDNQNKQVKINDNIISLGENAVLENNRVLVSLRYFGELLNCEILWNNQDKIATIIK